MRILNKSEGFSIVELLLTITVLSVLIGTFTTLFVSIKSTNLRAKMVVEANSTAYAKLQEYENKQFSAIPTGDSATNYEVENFTDQLPNSLHLPVNGYVYSESVSPTLKKVRVHVDYNGNSRQRDLDYTTYIQQSGAGR